MKNYYEILKLSSVDASLAEITKSYQLLLSNETSITDILLIQEAFDILSDPVASGEYKICFQANYLIFQRKAEEALKILNNAHINPEKTVCANLFAAAYCILGEDFSSKYDWKNAIKNYLLAENIMKEGKFKTLTSVKQLCFLTKCLGQLFFVNNQEENAKKAYACSKLYKETIYKFFKPSPNEKVPHFIKALEEDKCSISSMFLRF